MATIGKLAVQITADTAGLSSGLAAAGRQTDDFQARLGGLASKLKIIGPAAIAAGGAFAVGMIKSVANTADELAKLSARTGVAVEDLSRLQYAANLSGVSSQAMTTSIERLSRSMADAASGTGRAAESFQQLGISVKNEDGTLKSQRDILEEIAERFAGMEDGARKSALAQEILGRSGTQLIPLLNAGAKGIKDMADESDRLGNTISTRTAKSAEEFNDNITRMTTAMGGLARTIAGPVIESLAKFTTAMFDAWKQGDTLIGMLERGFKRLGQAGTIEQARAKVNELEAEMHKLMATPGFDPANMGAMNLARNLDEARKRLHELLTEQQKAADDASRPGGLGGLADDGKINETKEKISTLGQFLDDLDQKFKDSVDLGKTKYLEGLEDRLEALQESVKTEEQIMLEKHAKELADLEEILEEKIATEQEYMLLRQDLEHKHMEELGNIRERAYQDDQRRIQQAAQFEIEQRRNVANAAIGFLSQLGSKSKAAAIAAIALGKGLSIAQAIQNTAVAYTKALTIDPTGALASRVAALGRVQVGIIAATGLAQAASVGSSGGTAGLSSASAIQDAATGGAGGVGGGGSSAGRVQTVTIQLQGETFGREAVRNLISEINEAISDGAVLRLA